MRRILDAISPISRVLSILFFMTLTPTGSYHHSSRPSSHLILSAVLTNWLVMGVLAKQLVDRIADQVRLFDLVPPLVSEGI